MTSMPPRARAVLERVAAESGLTVKALLGKARDRRHAQPRQRAYAELYGMATGVAATRRYSLPQIGRWMDRDHSTVLHGIRAHAQRAEEGA